VFERERGRFLGEGNQLFARKRVEHQVERLDLDLDLLPARRRRREPNAVWRMSVHQVQRAASHRLGVLGHRLRFWCPGLGGAEQLGELADIHLPLRIESAGQPGDLGDGQAMNLFGLHRLTLSVRLAEKRALRGILVAESEPPKMLGDSFDGGRVMSVLRQFSRQNSYGSAPFALQLKLKELRQRIGVRAGPALAWPLHWPLLICGSDDDSHRTADRDLDRTAPRHRVNDSGPHCGRNGEDFASVQHRTRTSWAEPLSGLATQAATAFSIAATPSIVPAPKVRDFVVHTRAARMRPCPAMMPPSSSASTGFVQPHSRIDAAICAIWESLCVRAFRA
jgi:hypothetical protein